MKEIVTERERERQRETDRQTEREGGGRWGGGGGEGNNSIFRSWLTKVIGIYRNTSPNQEFIPSLKQRHKGVEDSE